MRKLTDDSQRLDFMEARGLTVWLPATVRHAFYRFDDEEIEVVYVDNEGVRRNAKGKSLRQAIDNAIQATQENQE